MQAVAKHYSSRFTGGCCMLMANVLNRFIRESSLLAPDFESFKRQESAFITLNLSVLAALLLFHTLFSSIFGTPPGSLIVVLATGFLLYVIELIWLQSAKFLTAGRIVGLTWASISLNTVLAFVLASLSYRQDAQYFALLVTPILQAAFRLQFAATIGVVAASAALDFFWVWNYFRLHPPPQVSEYVEAGTISLIYAMVGVLVWILVNHLRSKQSELAASIGELQAARERLLNEEKLAAVGRFSSAIAHEIRNPVAMISSALATAFQNGSDPAQRQEMFEIAAKEASRLEKLTSDFLAYARPRQPAKQCADIAESIAYVADICRPHALERGVTIRMDLPGQLYANIDSGQMQQAMINLVMNAVQASSPGSVVVLRGQTEGVSIRIDVESANGPIPADTADHIFEPFFTTRPGGTGLGLAIARNIARGHDGELALSQNRAGAVQFSISLPAAAERAHS